jgi:parallel beta-helix repeat protein
MMKIQRVFLACAISVFALAANAATFQVITNADSGPGTLRQAILDANAETSAATITFNIPIATATIRPLTPLPPVASHVSIDGRSQPGTTPGDAIIEINGSMCGVTPCTGLAITGTLNLVNLTGWSGYGIDASGDAIVTGCRAGVKRNGEPNANGTGIRATGRAQLGIAVLSLSANTIAGNTLTGVLITSSTGVGVYGNKIGTEEAPNGIGVLIQSIPATGSTNATIASNLVVMNTTAQISVADSAGIVILGNTIRENAYGTRNSIGIRIKDSTSIRATENTITSPRIGISVEGTSAGNTLTENRISGTDIGIDLGADGRTPNDDRDGDSGPNGLQNYPVLTSAIMENGVTTVSGTLNSAPNQTYDIHLYGYGVTCGSGGTEGGAYTSRTTATTDGNGNAAFALTATTPNANVNFTATATGPSGGTSEFSSCVLSETHGTLVITPSYVTSLEGTTVTLTVARLNGATGAITVDYATANGNATAGSDFTAAIGKLQFASGETSKVVTIPLLNDAIYEGNENFTFTLSNATGGASVSPPGQVTVTITDATPRPAAIPTATTPSIVEGDSGKKELTFTVTLQQPTAIPLTYVCHSVGGGTATYGSDYELLNAYVTFQPGEMTKTIALAIIGDTVYEDDEQIVLSVDTDPFLTEVSHQVRMTILNDDPANEITVKDAVILEGDSGVKQVIITMTATAPFTGNTAFWTTGGTATPDSDYFPRGFTLPWYNSKEETVTIPIYGDMDVEADETFQAHLSTASTLVHIVRSVGTITIQNDDAAISPATQSLARGARGSVTIILGQPVVTDEIIPITVTQPTAFQVPSQIVVHTGLRIVSFDVIPLAAPAVSRIDVALPASLGARVLSVNVNSYEPGTLQFLPATVSVASGASVTVSATLAPPAAEAQVIELATADARVAGVSASVTIPPGGVGTFNVVGREAGSSGIRATLPPAYGSRVVTLFVDVRPTASAPLLISVSPATGPAAGGTPVTISGSRMLSDCSVTFNNTPAQATFVSESQFSAIAPAQAAGTVDVRLSCSSGSYVLTNAFTYLSSGPTLSAVAPSSGTIAGGTMVKLTGTNLSSACGVFFDGVAARGVERQSATLLTAIAPPHSAGTVNVGVRCGNAATTLGGAFSYNASDEPATTITGISPDSGSIGQQVTITGSRFRTHDSVTFGSSSSPILSTTGETHVVTIPDLPPGKVAITITDPNDRVTTTGPIFTIVESSAPQITRATPSTVIAGNELVVEGEGFRAGYGFTLGNRAATIISMTYARSVVRVPAIDAGTYPLNIVTAAGNVAAIGPSIVIASQGVAISGVSTSCSSTNGGQTITIRGSGFASGASVTFADIAATNVIVVDANTITATIPASSSAGAARIVVTNTNGDSGSLTGAFRYVSPFDPDGCGGMRRRVGKST